MAALLPMQHDATTLPLSYRPEINETSQQDSCSPAFSFPSHPSHGTDSSSTHRRRASHRREPSMRMTDDASSSVESLPRAVPSVTPLPAFTFNPAASIPASASGYTPVTTSSLVWHVPDTPTRPSRHGKSISEFIGGQNSTASPRFRSVSPKKPGHQPVPAPNIEQLQTPPFRRHGHRRSGAISQDLSMLGKSDALAKLTLSPESLPSRKPTATLPWTATQCDSTIIDQATDQPFVEPLPRQAPSRSRVLFVDAPEYISRPLSTVSSGTDSSMSTIRFHAPNSSTSGVDSNMPGSPAARTASSPLAASTPVDSVFSFPNMASSVHEPVALPPSPVSAAFSDHIMAVAPISNADPELPCLPFPSSDAVPVQLSENFDEDPTSTIISDSTDSDYVIFTSPATTTSTVFSRTDKSDSPVIDLDSALSPFRDGDDGQEGVFKGRGFSKARRSMHSSHMLSGFFGPGMHYHRRVESAPSFGGFEYERSDLFRPSAAMETGFTMEDVNEEEEDALASARLSKRLTGHGDFQPTAGQDITTALGLALSSDAYDGATPSEDDMHSDNQSENELLAYADSCTTASESGPPLADAGLASRPDDELPEIGSSNGSCMTSSDSTLTSVAAARAQRDVALRPSPMEGNEIMSGVTYAEPGCVCDATSSVMHASLGQSSEEKALPAQRASVDDVPSLMSSRSTGTSTAHRDVPYISLSNVADGSNRSQTSTPSVSSSSRQRRKRSSIASLSKLMANGFRERSLSPTKPASTPQPAGASRESRESQGRRFGRLLKMLRPK